MLTNLLRGELNAHTITFFLSGIFVLISSISMHEFAHGYAAYKLGDNTAKYAGRLTLNPIAHLDPIGTVMMMLFGFGWAKPVPVNTLNFKNQRKGLAITALAGPVANLLIAFMFMIVLQILARADVFVQSQAGIYFYWFFYWIVVRNIMLAVFNLLPVPPLDGSRILSAVLPDRLYRAYVRYERMFYFLIIIFLVTGILGVPLQFLTDAIFDGFDFIVSLPFRLFS